MRTTKERLTRLLKQQQEIQEQIIELQGALLNPKSSDAEGPPWPKGRLSKKRAHLAIQIILRENGGKMKQERIFEILRSEGWYPPTSKDFYLMNPSEQENTARGAFNNSLTRQIQHGKLEIHPGGIVSLPEGNS